MKRYRFKICSELSDSIKRVNDTMKNFGFDGKAIYAEIGNVDINVPDDKTVEFIKLTLEKTMNEMLTEKKQPTIFLTNVGYIEGAPCKVGSESNTQQIS